MSGKQRMIRALERRPFAAGEHVPHFELVFFLTMEAFGRVHFSQRRYAQWDQMSEKERELHRQDMADLYIETAKHYDHDAIFLHPSPATTEEALAVAEKIRERTGDEYFLMLHGDPTYGIPGGDRMVEFSVEMAEEPEKVKREAERRLANSIREAEKIAAHPGLIDGFALCSDYCFNTAPFMSPLQFSEFVTPYLQRVISEYRNMGFYAIKHTDGNIMPILDQMVQAEPHALHSIDPQAGVDLAEVKRMYGDRLCLIGNVNCGLLQPGTEEEVGKDVRRALRDGMPGGGFIFSTSNCVYTGMELERYHLMHRIWREEGVY